jgi:uncharacterized protein (DUF1697 family)
MRFVNQSYRIMALVVFFRAVNVGGYQKFQPGLLAKEMAEFGVVNIGAAGTYVVRMEISESKLRKEILSRMPFKPELIICSGAEVEKIACDDCWPKAPAGKDIQRFVTAMTGAPATKPLLPLQKPDDAAWEVKVAALVGQFALSYRRPGPRGIYPNAIVEKAYGVAATTRSWNTIGSICKKLPS